jgi:signal transduction histidine kinase
MEIATDLFFPRKLSHKLALAFALVVFVVAAVGGGSLYLARSISDVTQTVKEESDQNDLLDQVHNTFHHLTEAVERAVLNVDPLTEGQRKRYLEQIRELLREYRTQGRADEHATKPLWEALRQLDSTSQNILKELNESPGKIPSHEELLSLMNVELKVQALAHWLSGIHKSKMEESIKGSTWKMRLIVQLYGGVVVTALLMILGSIWYFSRTIAQPLSSLAQAAFEVAEGKINKNIPVRSKDEVGQLGYAFNVMLGQLRERDQMLQSLATLEERERIAQELHDTLVQDLILVQMKLTDIEKELPPDASKAIVEAVEDMRNVTGNAYEDARQAIFGLQTMVSKGLGLIPTLAEYLHEFSAVRKFPVELKVVNSKPFQLSALAEIQVIHIINEALSNVFKHSQAQKSIVSFDHDGTYAKVTIEDNGNGFDPHVESNGYHIGIHSMRKRAERVNGQLSVESAPGKGTKVIASFPSGENLDETHSNPAGR